MDPYPRARRPQLGLNFDLPLAPTVAALGGVLIAMSFAIMPSAALERLVGSSGLPGVVGAAEPPLGHTARSALALLLGTGFAGLSWFGLQVLAGDANFTVRRAIRLFRRSDVHPDGPPRPPLFAARDLGTPFLEISAAKPAKPETVAEPTPVAEPEPVIAPEPVASEPVAAAEPPVAACDWTAMFDMNPTPVPQRKLIAAPVPAAVLTSVVADDATLVQPVPLRAPAATAPLARPSLIDPGDRFETFELTPVARAEALSLRAPVVEAAAADTVVDLAVETPAAEPVVGPATEATVHDLLARLERGLVEPAPVKASLQDTLGDLRRMAVGGR